MSRAQRLALDARLRSVPQPAGPVSIEAARAGFAAFMGSFRIPERVTRTPTSLAGRPAVLVEPDEGARAGTILYLHGGSYSLGSPQTAMPVAAQLVARTGVRARSLDYRLAPEHPFPAGLEDCLAAYRALLDDGEEPASIVLAGDSAGGGLAVSTALAARDAGLPMPAAIVAFSPGLDQTRSSRSMSTRAGEDPFFTPEALTASSERYRAGQDPAQPLLSPAVHADLRGLPPILLQVGTHELLLDDAVRLALRAVDADVDVVLDVVAGVPHVFQAFVDELEEAGDALDRAALFVGQHLPAS